MSAVALERVFFARTNFKYKIIILAIFRSGINKVLTLTKVQLANSTVIRSCFISNVPICSEI